MIYRRKLFVLLFFLLSIHSNAFSQIGAGMSLVKPSGDFSFLFKSAPAFELYWRETDPDDPFQYFISLGIYKFHTRKDTMPVYAIRDDGGNYTLLPGWQTVTKYIVIPLGIHADYRFMKEKFTPFAGVDIHINFYSYVNHYYIEALVDMEDNNSSAVAAIMPKIGFYYQLSRDLDFTFGIGKAFGADFGNSNFQSYWKSYFCLFYSY